MGTFRELAEWDDQSHTRMWDHLNALRSAGIGTQDAEDARSGLVEWRPTWRLGGGSELVNGTGGRLEGKYLKIGLLYLCSIVHIRGTNANQGPGAAWTYDLPVNAVELANPLGSALVKDQAATAVGYNVGVIGARMASGGAWVTWATPGSWVANDPIRLTFMYIGVS